MDKSQDIKIIYIDDEEHNLQSFKANFRKDYTIYTTTSTTVALELIEQENIGIILADQRMPEMTGVEFFEIIRSKYPDKIRILITGYTDIAAAIDAINKGEVFRFIDKPWDRDYVQNTIAQAYEIVQTREELHKKNQDLIKANEELDHFIYSASHDLRAPLMSILGITQLSEHEENSGVLREYFALIQQSVLRLDSFVLNIIDYYRNTRSSSLIEQVDFKKLVDEILTAIKYMPNFDKILFSLNISQDEPFKIDVIKTRIILNNLLSNAIKYQDVSKEFAKIDIDIKVLNNNCSIDLKDNGIGIAQNQINKIFQMFYKGNQLQSGSGVGLYIVEEAVTKLKGSIKVHSTEKVGTTFSVLLPGHQ